MDRIAYVLVTDAGGVDGRDSTAHGGIEIEAFFDEESAKKHKLFHQCHIEKRIVELEPVKKEALAKLSAVDKLVLGLIVNQETKRIC